MRRPYILRRGCRTYRDCIGKFFGIGVGALVKKDGQVKGLGGLVQVEEIRRKAARLKSMEKESSKFSNCSKQAKAEAGEKTDKKESEKYTRYAVVSSCTL